MYLQRGIDTQRIPLFNSQNLKELRSSEEEEESQEDIATYVCDPMTKTLSTKYLVMVMNVCVYFRRARSRNVRPRLTR